MLLLLTSMGCEVSWQAAPGAAGAPVQGQAPVLGVHSPDNGAELPQDGQTLLLGTVQDDQDSLQVTVSSDVDGDLGSATVQGQDWSLPLELSVGAHTLSITALDPSENQSTLEWQLIQLGNQPPSLPELRIAPAAPVNGEALQLVVDVASQDPEGGELFTTLSWSRDGEVLEQYADQDNIPMGVVVTGETWQLTQSVSDGELTITALASVSVDGSGPAVQISLDPPSPSAADDILCDWTAFDPDGDPVVSETGRWFVNGEDAGNADTSLDAQIAGTQIRCEVTATSTEATTRSVEAEVRNAPPTIDSVVLSGAPAREADSLGCTAQASDFEGDAVQIDLSWYVNGVLLATGEFLDGADFDRGNDVWCAAQARDEFASGDLVESEHTFILNTSPESPTVALSPDPAVPGDVLTCNPAESPKDADPFDVLTLSYVWKVNGANQGVNNASFDTTGSSGGDTVWCKIEVTDGTAVVSGIAEMNLEEVLGGTLALSDGDLQIIGSQSKAAFGHTVISPGDLDGDGIAEILVSGESYSSSRGSVWFFDGASLASSQADTDADAWWRGTVNGDALGSDQGIAVAGDLDNDGLVDLLMASPLADGAGNELGVVYLMSGADTASWGAGVNADRDASLVVSGVSDKDRLGSGLASMDLDGDGIQDLLLSSPYEDTQANAAGAVYVFYGGALLSGEVSAADADVTLLGSASTDRMGLNSPRALGDVDGDGQDDLMIGSYNADAAAGVAYILDPSSLSDGTAASQASAQITGASGDSFGISAISLSDLDGDGADEILIGARTASVDASQGGGVYFWFGDAGLSGTVAAAAADASWGVSNSDVDFGWDLSVGDVDGDGIQDWSTGAYATDTPNNSGTAWLVSGSGYGSWTTGLNIGDSARAAIQGDTGGMYVGRTPFIVPDMNGDGADEWMVAGEGVAAGSTKRAGQVSIFFGP
ncbi:MAG: hypothetical protein ACI9VR_001939 [Cognaticolwellia sp.]|jgi:hypothetical protein